MTLKQQHVLTIFVSTVICLVAGFIPGMVTASAIKGWYATIQKPAFNPPNYVFGPVWTLLYILMGVAVGIVWNNRNQTTAINFGLAIGCFTIQLILNAAWSLIFFLLQSPGWASAEIVILWLAIVACILTFYKIKKIAAYLLIPYLLWVSFATLLSFSIFKLNS